LVFFVAMATPLADVLLAAVPDTACDREALEHAIVRTTRLAKDSHPTIDVPPDVFVAFIAHRLAADVPPLHALEALRVDDLYLACACARGDRRAIAAVERASFDEIEAAVQHHRLPASQCDEVKQTLRERLFVGDHDRPPRIAEYAGRGSLRRWVYAIAARVAIDWLRRSGQDVPADDAILDRALPAEDPEVSLLKQRYSAEFRGAVRDAVQELSVEARSDLRFYYVDGLRLDELAELRGVTAPTVSRRLAKSREQVLARTRTILRDRLRVDDGDVDSILRIIGSRLELGVSALSTGEPNKE
jgi:RNA polymerase sigma-70 factor (ECF subfamily)